MRLFNSVQMLMISLRVLRQLAKNHQELSSAARKLAKMQHKWTVDYNFSAPAASFWFQVHKYAGPSLNYQIKNRVLKFGFWLAVLFSQFWLDVQAARSSIWSWIYSAVDFCEGNTFFPQRFLNSLCISWWNR